MALGIVMAASVLPSSLVVPASSDERGLYARRSYSSAGGLANRRPAADAWFSGAAARVPPAAVGEFVWQVDRSGL